MILEYDETKNQKNVHKHHISIPELATIFENPFAPPMLDIPDKKHSKREKRYHAYGWTTTGWYVKIWYTYCHSAPKQTKRSAIRTKALYIKKSRTV